MFQLVLLLAIVGIFSTEAAVYHNKHHICGPCYCPKETNPVCVNDDSARKKFVTYPNACEWLCYARCYEPTSRFMYCGTCDKNKELPKKGTPLNLDEAKCLEAALKASGGVPSA